MNNPGPRAGGPSRRRTFTTAETLDLLAGYEQAVTTQNGGAYLRENGLFSSQMTEWRKQRDAGVLDGKNAGATIGKLTAEQAEIARLRRALAVSEGQRKKTEEALEIMGKLSAFFENAINESQDEPGRSTLESVLCFATDPVHGAFVIMKGGSTPLMLA